MVEQIVDFTLGFVICGLLGLAFLPLVSARARRLTLARIEARLPMTFEEIEAERDLLRARFAVENRTLEIKATEARGERAAEAAELGRRAVAVMRANEQLDQTNALLNERNIQLARSLEFGEKTQAELDETRETLAARQKDLELKSAEYDELVEAHRRLDHRAATLDAALATATAGLRDAHAQFEKVEAERSRLAAQVEQLTERDQSLSEQLTEAERRLADFEARRTRLLAKIAAERTRAEDLENTNLDLRRLLASAGAEAATPDAGLNGAILAFGPQQEMLDLREAITKIGRQVARLNAAEE